MSEPFIDTNVALYLISTDATKASTADALVRRGGVISAQVLTEFADVAHRKYKVTWPILRGLLDVLRATLHVVPVTIETHEAALDVAERYRFRIYDAQLIAAALQAGCTIFWSEDLHNGQLIEGQLTIRNPFA